MKILALDPATHCGWCLWDGTQYLSGTWDLSVRRDESGGMRLVRFRGKLAEVFRECAPIDAVVFEAARNGNPKMQGALVVQSELQGVLKLFCEQAPVEYRGYSPSEIKRHATGKGNANKLTMLAAARAKWAGYAFADDNEADARWLCNLARQELHPPLEAF